MLMMMVRYTPVWVWALLAALVALGLWQTRPQRMARIRVVALPLVLLGLGLSSLLPAFATLPAAALAWTGCLLAALAAGRRWLQPANATWLPEAQRLMLPGSWLPLGLIVVIFMLRYSLSVGQALHPELRVDTGFLLASAAISGTLGGLFLGRALGLLALSWHRPATIAA